MDVQTTLVEAGQGQGPDCLRRIGNRIMSHLDPDGQKPSHSDLLAKQGLFFRKPRRGLIHIDGYMTIAQHEQLLAAIGHATNPNHHADVDTITTTTNTADSADPADSADSAGTAEMAGNHGADAAGAEVAAAKAGAGRGADVSNGSGDGGQDSLFEQLNDLMGLFAMDSTGATQNEAPQDRTAQAGTGREKAARDGTRQARESGQAGNAGASGMGWTAQLGPDVEPVPGWSPSVGSESDLPPGSGSDQEEPGGGERAWRSVWDEVPGQDEEERRGRVVDGVRIPWPGSAEMLEGLDPIDPNSTDPVVKDDRTYAQKLLDGLLECVKLAARTGKLPLNGGLKAQLIVMTRKEDLTRRDGAGRGGAGTAFTAYNGPVPLGLFDQELCDPEITNLLEGDGQEILNVGRAQRLFTPAQRKILFARDLGCSFPDCTIPAPWTEAHHVLPWQEGGESNISNAALLCGRHHTLIHHSEWSMALVQGTPCFTAPYLIDPTQTPRRNTYHHGITKNSHTTQN